jgi:lysophospholipase
VKCPSEKPTIRRANTLSKSESDWLQKRRPATVDPMIAFLKLANIGGFDAETYIKNVSSGVTDLPNIAIAVSGGGYRALMNGAGFLSAADSRTSGSTDNGGIGGLLQASTYLYAPLVSIN